MEFQHLLDEDELLEDGDARIHEGMEIRARTTATGASRAATTPPPAIIFGRSSNAGGGSIPLDDEEDGKQEEGDDDGDEGDDELTALSSATPANMASSLASPGGMQAMMRAHFRVTVQQERARANRGDYDPDDDDPDENFTENEEDGDNPYERSRPRLKASSKGFFQRQFRRYTSLPSFFRDRSFSQTDTEDEDYSNNDHRHHRRKKHHYQDHHHHHDPYYQQPPIQQPSFRDDSSHYSSKGEPHPHHVLLMRQPYVSLEKLNPEPECETRRSSSLTATFNLVASVCGGGVLSLPLCFQKAGIVPTTLLMLYGAATTDFTLYLLIACARRTGGRSYGDVAQAAYGKCAQVVTTVTLSIMLYGTLIAYQVLVKQIWSSVVYSLFPSVQQALLRIAPGHTGIAADNVLLLSILILGFPLLLKKDLHALRHTCYVGFSSCILLMCAVVYRATQTIRGVDGVVAEAREAATLQYEIKGIPPPPSFQEPFRINWYSTDPKDILFAYPIVVLSFFCSYNVLGVHSQLVQPTRHRMRKVLDWSMFLCFTIFYLVGLCGYLYAGNATLDNILVNFATSDSVVLPGRAGYCLTLLFGLPLILLPLRDAVVSIPQQIHDWRHDEELIKTYRKIEIERKKRGAHLIVNGVDFDEKSPVLVRKDMLQRHGVEICYGTAHITTTAMTKDKTLSVASGADSCPTQTLSGETTCATTPAGSIEDVENNDKKNANDPPDEIGVIEAPVWKEHLTHFLNTLAILSAAYIAAVIIPDVSTVWSIFGSSMAMWIAFIVPCGCYLKIREHKGMTVRAIAGSLLLVVSCIAAVVCTRQAFQNAMAKASSNKHA